MVVFFLLDGDSSWILPICGMILENYTKYKQFQCHLLEVNFT